MYIVLDCMYGAIIFGASTCKTRDIFTLPHYGCTSCINQVLYVAASAVTDTYVETHTHTHAHTHTHTTTIYVTLLHVPRRLTHMYMYM